MAKLDPSSFSHPLPPNGLAAPLQALWWLKKGGLVLGPEWEKAHAICQQDEGNPEYDVVHALAHWIEGDEPNAAYWYRRIGAERAATISEEWDRILGNI
jgi:hypothetical protein